ncbi:hypothetical protein pb186bvf_005941 [Paramecium bursaria]
MATNDVSYTYLNGSHDEQFNNNVHKLTQIIFQMSQWNQEFEDQIEKDIQNKQKSSKSYEIQTRLKGLNEDAYTLLWEIKEMINGDQQRNNIYLSQRKTHENLNEIYMKLKINSEKLSKPQKLNGRQQKIEVGDLSQSSKSKASNYSPLLNEYEHSQKQRHIENHIIRPQYIRSFVYGGIDGIITLYQIIMSSYAVDYDISVMIIVGLTSLISDGLSMGMGDFLSSRAESQFIEQERRREQWEVENDLDGEKAEMIFIYQEQGLDLEDAKTIVNTMSKYKNAFVDIMMHEELHLGGYNENPFINGLVTFFAFVGLGILPLVPYLISFIFYTKTEQQKQKDVLIITSSIIYFSLFPILGILVARLSNGSYIKNILQQLFIATTCTGATYCLSKFIVGDMQNF